MTMMTDAWTPASMLCKPSNDIIIDLCRTDPGSTQPSSEMARRIEIARHRQRRVAELCQVSREPFDGSTQRSWVHALSP